MKYKSRYAAVLCIFSVVVVPSLYFSWFSRSPLFCNVKKGGVFGIVLVWGANPPLHDSKGNVLFYDVFQNQIVVVRRDYPVRSWETKPSVDGATILFAGTSDEVYVRRERNTAVVYHAGKELQRYQLPSGFAERFAEKSIGAIASDLIGDLDRDLASERPGQ